MSCSNNFNPLPAIPDLPSIFGDLGLEPPGIFSCRMNRFKVVVADGLSAIKSDVSDDDETLTLVEND